MRNFSPRTRLVNERFLVASGGSPDCAQLLGVKVGGTPPSWHENFSGQTGLQVLGFRYHRFHGQFHERDDASK